MRKINWAFHVDLETPHNEERNNIVKDIVSKYENHARMGRETLIAYCIFMFCAGAEYQRIIINAELACECPSGVMGNAFVTAMNEAIKEADIVAFASDLPILLECGKECFNNGIHYANDRLHDAVNDINDMEEAIL